MVMVLVLALMFLLSMGAMVISLTGQYRQEIEEAYQRIAAGSHILVTENGEIEYGLEGEGIPALLIHGAGGGYDQGLLMGRAFLGSGYQLVAVSRFGYLGSPLPETEATVEKQALLYAGLLDYLEIQEAVIVGVSAGGPSAVQFAHDYPERTSALVLASAVSQYMGEEIPMSTKVVNTIQKSDAAYWLVLKTFRTQFLSFIGIPPEIYNTLEPNERQFADHMLELMHPMSPRRPGNIHEASIIPLSGAEMGAVNVPALILHAQDDTLVSYQQGLFYHQHLPGSQMVSFDKGGHGMATELEDIQRCINDFLEAVI